MVPGELAIILDKYQYRKCKDAKDTKDKQKRQVYLKKRDIAIDLIFNLQIAVSNLDRDGAKSRERFESAADAVRDFLLLDYHEEKRRRELKKLGIGPELWG